MHSKTAYQPTHLSGSYEYIYATYVYTYTSHCKTICEIQRYTAPSNSIKSVYTLYFPYLNWFRYGVHLAAMKTEFFRVLYGTVVSLYFTCCFAVFTIKNKP